MASRLELQTKLEELLGSRNVYFQPPASVKMQYPAIVYELDDIANRFANDSVYNQSLQYKITVMDFNPDSEIVKRVSKLPRCRFNRHFTSDNLNHDVFTIY
jgi:hypothetical protein